MSLRVVDQSTVAIRKLRCPKCRKPPVALIEVTEALTSFTVRDGVRRDVEGYHLHGGSLRVHARCEDDHRWRVRGASQIWDIDTEPEPTP